MWQRPADDSGHYVNKNVNWVGKRFAAFYVAVLVVGAYAAQVLLVDATGLLTREGALTFVNVVHGLINFTVMHYVTGAPAELDTDEYYLLTWWEQLDDGVPWTDKKRNLITLPVVLFLLVSHASGYKSTFLAINLAVLALVTVPKLPQFYKVRVRGLSMTTQDEHAKSS
jgi:hypothetical protein